MTPPVSIAQESNRLGAAASFAGREQAAHGGLHAKNLEEIPDDFDPSGWFGLATSGEAKIVRSGEGLVAGDVLIGAALSAKFFVGIR